MATVICIYPVEGLLDKHTEQIENFIAVALSDANGDARLNGKVSF